MNDIKVKQQIVEKIKNSTNILVTVSVNPSVDELSAALGLTVMLNKLGKHATAVFSGTIPPAITFLDPEKTFENTVDSLRDFIIALDKEKADHLRYKVEGDVVKIFITPYRTTITNDDLEFSQGDYNVEVVLALGVDNQEHLDGALEAHGRILHDATVATITSGEQTSDLGSLDWHDDQASSLSEMMVSLSESIKGDKPLLDAQISTAFLTGIVAATDRFSNTLTSSRVMTMAAQLMAAGADQQLIAAKLQESHAINETDTSNKNGETTILEDTSVKLDKSPQKKAADGELEIDHLEDETIDRVAHDVVTNNQQEAAEVAEEDLAEQTQQDVQESAPEPSVESQRPEIETPNENVVQKGAVNWTPQLDEEPMLGGTLNATAEDAAQESKREREDDQNKTILTHSPLAGSVSVPQPALPVTNELIETELAEENSSTPEIPSLSVPSPSSASNDPLYTEGPVVVPAPISETPYEPAETQPISSTPLNYQSLADIDAEARSRDHDEARAAVEQALDASSSMNMAVPPTIPTMSPFDLPPPPPLPDFSQLAPSPSPIASAYAIDSPSTPERLGDILAPDPILPAPNSSVDPVVPPAPSNDPGQFRIPGQ